MTSLGHPLAPPPTQQRGAGDALLDAQGHLVRARRRVEELRDTVKSAARVAEDIAQVADRARREGIDGGRGALQDAAEDLVRLHGRCELSTEVASGLTQDLDQAAAAVSRARHEATGEQLQLLAPRLDALEDTIEVSRPVARAASHHLHCAEEICGDTAAIGLTNPSQLEHRLDATDRRLERVDEDVRLLEVVTERAVKTAERSTTQVDDATEVARDRMAWAHRTNPLPGPVSHAGPPR
ncbi:MAG: hypothetical protein WKF79_06215 [Nocardioides sp.]